MPTTTESLGLGEDKTPTKPITSDVKEISHKGEKFEVSTPANCQIRVTGNGLTAQVSVKGSSYVIQVLNTEDNGQLYRSDCNPIIAACDRILNFSPKSVQSLCDGLEKAFGDL